MVGDTVFGEEKFDTHWANTSGNGLVGKLIREGDKDIKTEFEKLFKDASDVAVIMEFKMLSKTAGEGSLEDTAANALKQIKDKKYDTYLLQRGIPAERIYKYGFAFEGEKCLIRKA